MVVLELLLPFLLPAGDFHSVLLVLRLLLLRRTNRRRFILSAALVLGALRRRITHLLLQLLLVLEPLQPKRRMIANLQPRHRREDFRSEAAALPLLARPLVSEEAVLRVLHRRMRHRHR